MREIFESDAPTYVINGEGKDEDGVDVDALEAGERRAQVLVVMRVLENLLRFLHNCFEALRVLFLEPLESFTARRSDS